MAEELTLAEMYYHAADEGDGYDQEIERDGAAARIKKRKKKKERQENIEAFSAMANQGGDVDDQPEATKGLGQSPGTGLLGPTVSESGVIDAPAQQKLVEEDIPVEEPAPTTHLMDKDSSPERLENLSSVAPSALDFLGEDDTRSVNIYVPGGGTLLTTKDRKRIKDQYPDYSFWKNDTVEAFEEYLQTGGVKSKKREPRYRVDDRKRKAAPLQGGLGRRDRQTPDSEGPWISDAEAYIDDGLGAARVVSNTGSNVSRENRMFREEQRVNPDTGMPLRPMR